MLLGGESQPTRPDSLRSALRLPAPVPPPPPRTPSSAASLPHTLAPVALPPSPYLPTQLPPAISPPTDDTPGHARAAAPQPAPARVPPSTHSARPPTPPSSQLPPSHPATPPPPAPPPTAEPRDACSPARRGPAPPLPASCCSVRTRDAKEAIRGRYSRKRDKPPPASGLPNKPHASADLRGPLCSRSGELGRAAKHGGWVGRLLLLPPA